MCLVLFSSLAHSQTPPKPIVTGMEPKNLDWAYRTGTGFSSEELLLGEWHLVSTTEPSTYNNCVPSDDYNRTRYDISGIKNNDISVLRLKFNYLYSSFTKNKIDGGFTVEFLNINAKDRNQGPYEGTIRGTMSYDSAFSRWAFMNNDLSTETYYSYKCKHDQQSDQKMICEISENYVGSDLNKIMCAKITKYYHGFIKNK